MRLTAVIPAYQPDPRLVDVVGGLVASPLRAVVVVDDGSGPAFEAIFDAIRALPKVVVLRHAVNLGKGAALKTALNHVVGLASDDVGVVTADADGQHAVEDILRVAEALEREPQALVLGVRTFSSDVPLRSRFGNVLTRLMMRLLVGQALTDTQTGLRGIPRALAAELLRVTSSGYEFELDMLIASKHLAYPIRQVPIRTIYIDGNRTSHFNPVWDSMRIYFVLLRFSFVSLATAIIDNAVFFLVFRLTGVVWQSQAGGRAVALVFNYVMARRAVFLTRSSHAATLPRYLALVVLSGLASYALLTVFARAFHLPVVWAKLLAEGLLFLANFAVQRDFVFVRSSMPRATATNWDAYYQKVPPTARLTRRYTTRTLVAAIRRHAVARPRILEIGGANSCFLDAILTHVQPTQYRVVDANRFGLDLLQARSRQDARVAATHMDVRDLKAGALPESDLVFSVGLIEHFDQVGTADAVAAHFATLAPGGCAIISFPTPTWLYRATRAVLEGAGLWKFPDERPLRRDEVVGVVERHGVLVFEKTLWPLVLTQHLLVVRKAGPGAPA